MRVLYICKFLTLSFSVLIVGCRSKGDTLKENGVYIKEHVSGATNSYPWITVHYESREGIVDAPDIFGGMANPILSYKDLDGDGMEEIIYSQGQHRQIMKFSLKTKIFTVVENTLEDNAPCSPPQKTKQKPTKKISK